jgi:hypothetical protein
MLHGTSTKYAPEDEETVLRTVLVLRFLMATAALGTAAPV